MVIGDVHYTRWMVATFAEVSHIYSPTASESLTDVLLSDFWCFLGVSENCENYYSGSLKIPISIRHNFIIYLVFGA